MNSISVTLERYAEMRAEMEVGKLREEVLARAGLTINEWTVAQREWLEKMGTELERGRFELTNRYTQAFLERQRELKRPAAAAPALPPIVVPEPPSAAIKDEPMQLPAAGSPTPEPPVRSTTAILSIAQLASLAKDPLPFRPTSDTSPLPRPRRPLDSALPFRAAAPNVSSAPAPPHRPPTLTLDQYASLCAMLAVFPQQAEAIFAQHNLGAREDQLTLDHQWKERLRRDPTEYQAWSALYQRWHTHWMAQARQGGR